MTTVAAAQAAGYVIASRDAWGPMAWGPPVQVAQEYWQWCLQQGRPFVLVQTWGAPVVDLVLDTAPLGPDGPPLDEAAIFALLRLVSSAGRVVVEVGYHAGYPGKCWRAGSVPVGQAAAVAEELYQLARGGCSA